MIVSQCYTYEEIDWKIRKLAERYDAFTTLRFMGRSMDQRMIPMIRIGLGMESLVLAAGISGRDVMNPVLFLELAQEYCKAYQENTCIHSFPVRELLNRCSICLLPLVNPDGYAIGMEGFHVIRNPILRQLCKMKEVEANQWSYNARGILINGNFPCKSYIQQQLNEYPASEPETRALMKVFEEYDTIGYLNFQSRGRMIYHFRQSKPLMHQTKYQKISQIMQRLSGCYIGKEEENQLGERSAHYYMECIKKPAMTIETILPNPSEMPNLVHIQETYREIRNLPLKIIQKL